MKQKKYEVITPDDDIWFVWSVNAKEAKKHLPDGSKIKEINDKPIK